MNLDELSGRRPPAVRLLVMFCAMLVGAPAVQAVEPRLPSAPSLQEATANSAMPEANVMADPVIARVLDKLQVALSAPAAVPVDAAAGEPRRAKDAPLPSAGSEEPDLDAEAGASADDFDASGVSQQQRMSENEALATFYRLPGRRPLWVDENGFNARATEVLDEIARAGEYGLRPEDFPVARPKLVSGEDPTEALASAELALSGAALKYARYARGGRIDPRGLSRFEGRGPRVPDYPRLLADLADGASPGTVLRDENPHYPQFEALRAQLQALSKPPEGGLADFISQLGAEPPDPDKLRLQILMNMERWRWMPDRLGGDNDIYVWANVPELRVRIFEGGKAIFDEKGIFGLQEKQTPLFDDEIEWVEINPTWYVPDSIKVADILPDARHSGRMIEKYGLKIDCGAKGADYRSIDWSATDIRGCQVSQPIGPRSVLGRFKFKFPNGYSVYMHDTLNHRLFDQDIRVLSHGCVRVANPQRMAEILLGHDHGVTADEIAAVVASGEEHSEALQHKVPIHIAYFTARVDEEGKLQTYPDYYGHDHSLAEALYGRGDLFPLKTYVGSQWGPPSVPAVKQTPTVLPSFLR
jgi:murein L,D-transpeptidase YcbB/YkuD